MSKQMYKLTADERTLYVKASAKELHKAMVAYIKAERAKGRSLGEIIFCWTPVRMSSIPTER